MNVLMLGNGFDLNYELPTKYINFLNTINFVSQVDKPTFTAGMIFDNKELQGIDKGIAASYGKYAGAYDSIVVDAEAVAKFKALAQNNLWFSFLLNSFNKDIGWIDFEREISTVLHGFQEFLSKIETRFTEKEFPSNRIHRYVIKTFDFFYSQIVKAGVTSTGRRYESEYSVTDDFVVEYPLGSRNKVINKEKIIAFLKKELLELAEGLKLYLQFFVEMVVIKLVEQHCLLPLSALSNAMHIISFNYTNTYEQVYQKGEVYHIHGSLQDRIILGVNPDDYDKIETVDTLCLPFKKYYQRVIYQSDVKYLEWVSKSDKNISLVVMGHSLDETDKDIIMQLFDIAKDITVLFFDEDIEASLIANLIRIYGKERFDKLRVEKRLRFLNQNMDFDGFAENRSAKELEAQMKAIREIRNFI